MTRKTTIKTAAVIGMILIALASGIPLAAAETTDEQSDEQDDEETEIFGTVGETTIHSVEETEEGLEVEITHEGETPTTVMISQVAVSEERIGFERYRALPGETTTLSFATVSDPSSDRPLLTTDEGIERQEAIALVPPTDSDWSASLWLSAPATAGATALGIVYIWRRRDRAESDEPIPADQYNGGGFL